LDATLSLDMPTTTEASSSKEDDSTRAAERNNDDAAMMTATPSATEMMVRDPLIRSRPSATVRDGDFVLLHFGDGRQIFARCQAGKKCTVRINKKVYSTNNLVGIPYGTVLEQEQTQLVALPANAKLIPEFPAVATRAEDDTTNFDTDDNNNQVTTTATTSLKDNRWLVDTNTAQQLDQQELWRMREDGVAGAEIVASIIENSSTFDQKTAYSKAKYVVRKQKKYQPRCRIVRCNGATISEALYLKDPRKVMNLREDTLAQILSYANVSAGCQTIVLESCMGIVTGAMAQRMGGYGKILSIYSGQQPSFTDMLSKFNLSFAENASVKWLHAGDVFEDDHSTTNGGAASTAEADDPEQKDRDALEWPCVLQPHTRNYIETEVVNEKKRTNFLLKRAARFARKLCRHTPQEAATWLRARPSDSIIIVARYDPTETLLGLLPYLAPSCPFVVFCEFIEPLTECFRELQTQDLAINLRLSDTWMREYQVLEGRTHPNMTMSQSGGFILSGIKLDPKTGRNELDEDLLKEIKAQIGGRRGRKNKKTADDSSKDTGAKRRRVDGGNKGKNP
jgi:tRNA (adenine58-N1)-methyltransferase non-catalytic subunit